MGRKSLLHRYLLDIGQAWLAPSVVPVKVRAAGLARLGLDVRGAYLSPRLEIYGTRVSVAAGTFIGRRCMLDGDFADLTIGPGCSIGPDCRLITTGHTIGSPDHRAGDHQGGDVTIGEGCWLGAGVTVLPGVTVAPGCVIAAGAVVTKNTAPEGLYAGVPARRVRDLD